MEVPVAEEQVHEQGRGRDHQQELGVDRADSPTYARRSVVSFVRRTSKLPPKLQKAWNDYAPHYLLEIPNGEGENELSVSHDFMIDAPYVEQHWGTSNPLIIEIGTGQGENIAAAAQEHPENNYLALEVYDPGVAHTLLRAGKYGIENLRIAQVNATELFESALAPGLAAEVWTYFPDPWPKMKHHKRRIVKPALAQAVRKSLVDGGLWRIATDIDDYALHVHEVLDSFEGLQNRGIKPVSLATEHVGKGNAAEAESLPHAQFPESERFEGRVLTSFERKGLEKGHTVHDFTYQKV
ncbi:MAG: tRNA (guanosine(46)-N7)-methyltransferase TrmB [Bifidobacteriaceae bacterium]|jgi:tRNA (guanine-N7-)-methyltransferase|nr:tRNA (guanosine(46)-N7)-methyltransferase TrmB [Bifidobacteriaceae bacterium]